MASLEEIRAERLKKLELLKQAGKNPYPILSNPDFNIAEVIRDFAELTESGKELSLAGRVMAIRTQGAITFFNFNDGTGLFQGLLKSGEIDAPTFDLFKDTVDLGDFILVRGTLFVTKRNEPTIQVKDWTMLAKSLRPLPDKWHGLQDVEERFRRRYLDSLMSGEVKKRFILRSQIITAIRKYLDDAGYLEVETPILQPLAGGA
ncbi:MAG: OB-fold nucleic acid binding domain-containing protein, partial [Patescibacteria group bacterium]